MFISLKYEITGSIYGEEQNVLEPQKASLSSNHNKSHI